MTKSVREALDHIIDRQGIADHIYQGYAKPQRVHLMIKFHILKNLS